jgi:hypothetical protein
MENPGPARFATLTADLERFAEGFLDVIRRLGPEAGERFLGGLAEWCGSDLTDALFLVPTPLWRRLDAVAGDLQAACAAALAAHGTPAFEAAAERVQAVAAAAARLRGEG